MVLNKQIVNKAISIAETRDKYHAIAFPNGYDLKSDKINDFFIKLKKNPAYNIYIKAENELLDFLYSQNENDIKVLYVLMYLGDDGFFEADWCSKKEMIKYMKGNLNIADYWRTGRPIFNSSKII